MDPLFDVCFAGEILDGKDLAAVKGAVAKLFKADDATLDKLFSGKTQVIKRNCDRQTALKYKQAMEQAGAKPVVRKCEATPPQPANPEQTAPKMTAAERIAKLAAAPDISQTQATPPSKPAQAAAPIDGSAGNPDGMNLAPPGSDVLRPEERQAPPEVQVDISAIELGENTGNLAPDRATPPPAPDTSHLVMGDVGETIPNLVTDTLPLSPDTSGLDLTPGELDLSDCARPEVSPPDLNLSAMNLAEAGSDILADEFREMSDEAAPATDHISLEENPH